MLKLCRNTLGDWKTIFDENLVPIKWKYFEQLVRIQDEISLHLGTKIRKRHQSKAPYKRPLRKANEGEIIKFIQSSTKYLQNLYCIPPGKDENFIPIIKSTRKTGFIGLIITLKSIENLFNDTIKTDDLDFLLTYKLSQDHLEMFFSAIWARGGFNNNPTALQFESAYKRLLVHTEIKMSSGANCIAMDYGLDKNIVCDKYNQTKIWSFKCVC